MSLCTEFNIISFSKSAMVSFSFYGPSWGIGIVDNLFLASPLSVSASVGIESSRVFHCGQGEYMERQQGAVPLTRTAYYQACCMHV
jgi:hypothetical protein